MTNSLQSTNDEFISLRSELGYALSIESDFTVRPMTYLPLLGDFNNNNKNLYLAFFFI